MPIQVDHSKPIRTVDTTGKVVTTSTNNAAPIKTVDTAGRSVTPNLGKEAKAEAAAVAEKAAATMPNLPGAKPEEPKPTPSEAPKDEDKVTEAKIRKEYLEAQRIKRQAQELEKRAKANLDRAEAFEKARVLAENGEDPTALLRAAGLDPVKFYKDMTTYALSDKGKVEEVDPVKKELSDHRERLDKYAKDLEKQAKDIEAKEQLAAHNQVIQDTVIPMLKNNADRYETLIMHYGNQAAVEVYKNVWEIYQQTGQARKFDEVADEMEKYWSEQIETGLSNALQLKKFQGRFTQSASQEPPRDTKPEQTDTPNSSRTLSNKQQITAPPTSSNPYKGMTKEERVAAILKKFDS